MRVRFIYPWTGPDGKTHRPKDVVELAAGDAATALREGMAVVEPEAAKPESKPNGKAN